MSGFENISRIEATDADPLKGRVVWAPAKSLFWIASWTATLIGVIGFLRMDTVALFLVKTALVLLFGHSVGMHRRLIHKSFDCPLWLERTMVYLGVLVGIGGPLATIRAHDFRDWAQRQDACHPFFAHRRPPLTDAIWQLHCELRLDHPPRLTIENEVAHDPFYRFIERHWIAVHLPWILVFFLIGGWGWVIWGVFAQVAATATGHWLIGYLAHSDHADRDWRVRGAGIQGVNVGWAGLITMGESWHNNHHAFPGSARLGHYEGQFDPGYWFINALRSMGLIWNVRLPEHLPFRPQLQWAGHDPRPLMRPDRKPCSVMKGLGRALGIRPVI